MVAHDPSRIIVGGLVSDGTSHEVRGERHMIDARSRRPVDSTGGRERKSLHGRHERGVGLRWLADARHPLIEVAKDDRRVPVGIPVDNEPQMAQVGQMVLPRFAIPPTGTYVGVAPRDAHSDEPDVSDRRLRRACHESSWWEYRVAHQVNIAPWKSAPKHDLPPVRAQRVAIAWVGQHRIAVIRK